MIDSAQDSPVGQGGAPDLASLTRRLLSFRDARDWEQFHSTKNLMAALAVEAAELLEVAQWKTDAQFEAALADPVVKGRLEGECADVLLYLLLLAERVGIDLARAADAKITLNESRYPVAKARGNSLKYNEFD